MCTPRSAQHGDVVDDGRVLPHLGVHRRADHDRRAGGEQRVGEQVGRQTHPVRGDDPRRGRGHEDEVGPLADLGVRDRGGRVVPELGLHRLGGQRAERGAADEVFGAGRHDRHDVGAGVDETAARPRWPCRRRCPRSPRGRCACRRVTRHATARFRTRRSGVGIADGQSLAGGVGDRLRFGVGVELGLDRSLGPHDLVLGDLLETDLERLARHRRHLRRDHVAEAVTELVEVRVDVARPAGGERDQAELRVDRAEQAARSAG